MFPPLLHACRVAVGYGADAVRRHGRSGCTTHTTATALRVQSVPPAMEPTWRGENGRRGCTPCHCPCYTRVERAAGFVADASRRSGEAGCTRGTPSPLLYACRTRCQLGLTRPGIVWCCRRADGHLTGVRVHPCGSRRRCPRWRLRTVYPQRGLSTVADGQPPRQPPSVAEGAAGAVLRLCYRVRSCEGRAA